MALYSDHRPANPLLRAESRRPPQIVPHAVCVRLVGGWLVAVVLVLALVLTIRWYA